MHSPSPKAVVLNVFGFMSLFSANDGFSVFSISIVGFPGISILDKYQSLASISELGVFPYTALSPVFGFVIVRVCWSFSPLIVYEKSSGTF